MRIRSVRSVLVASLVLAPSMAVLTVPAAAEGIPDIYVMGADGSRPTNLTNDPASEGEPSWSPDGTKIAFARAGSVHVMDADGSDPVRLTNLESFGPDWSPDGTRIAFASPGPDGTEIYVMDADGSNQTRLTDSPGWDLMPDWSPDGAKIAFASGRSGGDTGNIYVMNADGTDPTRLTDEPQADIEPDWSPDGTRIAFTSGGSSGTSWDIWVMDADGSNPTNLTDDPAQDQEPAWSPDGTRMAYTTIRRSFEIFVMDADGANRVNITDNPFEDRDPSWSPDGTRIAYTSNPEYRMTVEPQRVQAGDPVTVSGAQCGSTRVEVEVYTEASEVSVFDEVVMANPDGNWSAVVGTTGWDAGRYTVRARCLFLEGGSFDYQASSFEVTGRAAPPAEPVPGEPSFTG